MYFFTKLKQTITIQSKQKLSVCLFPYSMINDFSISAADITKIEKLFVLRSYLRDNKSKTFKFILPF